LKLNHKDQVYIVSYIDEDEDQRTEQVASVRRLQLAFQLSANANAVLHDGGALASRSARAHAHDEIPR
jgi:hypothetical protein